MLEVFSSPSVCVGRPGLGARAGGEISIPAGHSLVSDRGRYFEEVGGNPENCSPAELLPVIPTDNLMPSSWKLQVS